MGRSSSAGRNRMESGFGRARKRVEAGRQIDDSTAANPVDLLSDDLMQRQHIPCASIGRSSATEIDWHSIESEGRTQAQFTMQLLLRVSGKRLARSLPPS
jgi:hypothetical protein